MRRRTLLIGLPAGSLSLVAGCLDRWTKAGNTPGITENDADAPNFDVDEDTPGTFVLLRIQPQKHRVSGTINVGDEFEVAVYLGNAGGEPIDGEVSVKLVPPNDEEPVQSATVGSTNDALPSGAARSYTAGLFEATIAGDWTLAPGPNINQVHPNYDGTIKVED